MPAVKANIIENDTVLLNELKVNPPGPDGPFEYIEIKGNPGALLTNVYLLAIEGNAGNNPGTINLALNLSSLPWTNAYERPHFEHGYEQGIGIAGVTITYGGSGYTSAPTITIDMAKPVLRVAFTPNSLPGRSPNPFTRFWFRTGSGGACGRETANRIAEFRRQSE